MNTLIERRATGALPSLNLSRANTTSVVQQGIVVQSFLGSVGAIEYLKARNIDSRVITRVLAGGRVRCDDDTMRASQARTVN